MPHSTRTFWTIAWQRDGLRLVAQIANLLYRRLAVGRVPRLPRGLRFPRTLWHPRHAGCQPAKQQSATLRYGEGTFRRAVRIDNSMTTIATNFRQDDSDK